ncbi:DUF1127 domain-containing protein [Paracoccaceae bacterium Fryx2]|nr:DUF1127 domain-containing protein [Paracoccaceae bacterium Fryx2]
MTRSLTIPLLPTNPLTRFARDATRTLLTWDERRRSRLHLGRMDGHMLRDIGLEQEAALREAQKPFWRG